MILKYKRMIKGTDKRKGKRNWSVYIVRCADGSLYTGTTNDLKRRIKMHNGKTGARYTRTRQPVVLVHQENGMNRSKALTRECAIKALSKQKKEELLAHEE